MPKVACMHTLLGPHARAKRTPQRTARALSMCAHKPNGTAGPRVPYAQHGPMSDDRTTRMIGRSPCYPPASTAGRASRTPPRRRSVGRCWAGPLSRVGMQSATAHVGSRLHCMGRGHRRRGVAWIVAGAHPARGGSARALHATLQPPAGLAWLGVTWVSDMPGPDGWLRIAR